MQRRGVHMPSNQLAHALERLREEVSADCTDMIYAANRPEIEAKRKAFSRKWRLKCGAVADRLEGAGDRLFILARFSPNQWKSIRMTPWSAGTRDSSDGSGPKPSRRAR